MNAVECSGLTKTFGRIAAVNELSCTMETNRITGLIGRNGAGKTTLLKIMAGLWLPSAGGIKIFGEVPFNNIKVASNLIFVDENMALPTSMNLGEILAAVACFYPHWDQELAQGLLEYFNLRPEQYHKRLSKGMRSTFNAILGLSARCALTLFDEPTTGMDAAVRKDFYRALLKEFMRFPRTIILSSHLLGEINEILDDVLLMQNGRQALHLPIDQLQTYAVALQGRGETIADITPEAEYLYRRRVGDGHIYAVVRHQFTETELQQIRGRDVAITPVAVDDLCMYLTSSKKGGIDDVLDRNESADVG